VREQNSLNPHDVKTNRAGGGETRRQNVGKLTPGRGGVRPREKAQRPLRRQPTVPVMCEIKQGEREAACSEEEESEVGRQEIHRKERPNAKTMRPGKGSYGKAGTAGNKNRVCKQLWRVRACRYMGPSGERGKRGGAKKRATWKRGVIRKRLKAAGSKTTQGLPRGGNRSTRSKSRGGQLGKREPSAGTASKRSSRVK